MAQLRKKVDDIIAGNSVVVFSKTYCPYCKAVKDLFQSLGVKVTVYELDKAEDGGAVQDELGKISKQRTVPNVFIGKEHIGGNAETQALNQSGALVSKLKAAGAM